MALKSFRPLTPSLRFTMTSSFEEITKDRPEKSLVWGKKKSGGRNNYGRTTAPDIGGGHKRRERAIDFKRNKDGIPAKVASIEYDPNRSARIALLHYLDGEKRYIIAPAGLKVGTLLNSGPEAEIQVGNALPLKNIPLGTPLHNIELRAGSGGKLVRSAGGVAELTAKEGKHANVKMPSGEVRLIDINCRATIGQVSNSEHENISIGKAGRNRWLGHRPRVRAVAMNPVDHPMGGGEGRTSGGRHPCNFYGVPAKGYKTRSKRKSTAHIVQSRKKK